MAAGCRCVALGEELTDQELSILSQQERQEARTKGCYGLLAEWREMNLSTNKRGKTAQGRVLGGSHAAGPSMLRGVTKPMGSDKLRVSIHCQGRYVTLATLLPSEENERAGGRIYDMALRAINKT